MSRIFGEKRSKTFWCTTQNLLILTLLCGLYSKQAFKGNLEVEKHFET